MGIEIQAIIIAATALVGSLGGIVAIFTGFLNKFKGLKAKLEQMAEAKELKAALIQSHQETITLKKTIITLVEHLDKIGYTDDAYIDQQVEDVLANADINVEDYYPENLPATKEKLEQEAK